MSSSSLRTSLLCFLLIVVNSTRAQKDIIIGDSLAANAEKLNVKMGTQWFGKIWKFRFETMRSFPAN